MSRVDSPDFAGNQRGLSLITTLLFMVSTMVLGVSVMSANFIQERITGNSKDRDLALQAAESTLRDAEQDISIAINPGSVFTDSCSNGLCTPPTQHSPLPATAMLPVEKQPGFSWINPARVRTYGQFTGNAPLAGVLVQPTYVIEKLGHLGLPPGESQTIGIEASRSGTAYRISVRAVGARAETNVILQSIFAVRN